MGTRQYPKSLNASSPTLSLDAKYLFLLVFVDALGVIANGDVTLIDLPSFKEVLYELSWDCDRLSLLLIEVVISVPMAVSLIPTVVATDDPVFVPVIVFSSAANLTTGVLADTTLERPEDTVDVCVVTVAGRVAGCRPEAELKSKRYNRK